MGWPSVVRSETPAAVAARTVRRTALDDRGSTPATDVRHHWVDARLPAGGGAQEHVAGH